MELIIAIVLTSMITRAVEESKRQSQARWAEARQAAAERRAVREDRRRAAAAARRRRVGTARKAGPSDPLWWLWAAAWLTAATVRGGVAAVDGARRGAAVGAREGYRLGEERARERARARRERQAREWFGPADRPDRRAEAVDTAPCPRCGAYLPDPAACPCRPRPRPRPTTDPPEVVDAEIVDDPAETTPKSESEVIDADVVDDPTTELIPIERNAPMAQLTSGISGGDGEGYATTITALTEIKTLLGQVNEIVNDLGDTLTSKGVDAVTTGLVSELDDHLQAAVNTAEEAARHAEGQHGEVAAAIAGAGGSSEIADKDWYDAV